ncbi:MAG: MFS transporter [Clostridia bacterium]|nr:MFS transporter [Clostridia bacterium]
MKKDEYAPSRLWVIVEAALEYFISIVTSGAYLAKITSALHFSDSLTGVLSSFVSLGCIFQLGSGFVFRRAKRVKGRVIGFQMAYQLLFVVVYLTPVMNAHENLRTGVFLTAFLSAYILINLVRSQKNTWMLSLIDNGKRGSFTAKKEIVSLLSGMIYTYIIGSAIDRYEAAGNMRGAFILLAIVIFSINALHMVSLCLTKERKAENAEKANERASIKDVVKNKKVMSVMLISVLWYITTYCATPFYGAYQVNQLKFSMRFISILSIVYAIVRSIVSPFMGRLADKHGFVKMAFVCFFVAAAGFLACAFTTPENGKILFSAYNVLNAVSMAGINSAILNIVFSYAPAEIRSQAIALNHAICGVCGFLTTCAASSIVDHIQANENMLWGAHLYPQQVMSAVAVILTLLLLLYTYFGVLRREKAH